MTQSLVKKAHALFTAGKFEEAKDVYLQLNRRFERGLFDANIILCDNRRSPSKSGKALNEQLQETQRLLEHYFSLNQTLIIQNKRAQ